MADAVRLDHRDPGTAALQQERDGQTGYASPENSDIYRAGLLQGAEACLGCRL